MRLRPQSGWFIRGVWFSPSPRVMSPETARLVRKMTEGEAGDWAAGYQKAWYAQRRNTHKEG